MSIGDTMSDHIVPSPPSDVPAVTPSSKPKRVKRAPRAVSETVAAVIAALTNTAGIGIGFAAVWTAGHAIRNITPKRDEPIPASVIADAVRTACTVADQPDNGSQRIGRFTGMGIVAFQNRLYVMNADPAWRFPDAVLTTLWAVEFPHAVCNFASTAWTRGYVGSTRSDYNRGKHGTVGIPVASIAYRRDGSPVASNVTAPKPDPIVTADIVAA